MSEMSAASALEEFVCQRCNACCRQPGLVYLRPGEEGRMAKYLRLSEFNFVNDYCEVENRRKLVLKKHEDETCIFLTSQGCAIHEVKPDQCREFPVKWKTPRSFDYCEGLKKLEIKS